MWIKEKMMNEENCLLTIFGNVNRWLDYAERKNTILFSSFSAFSFFSIISKHDNNLQQPEVIGTVVLYLFSLFFILLSLFPMTKISRKLLSNGKNRKLLDSDNLLFYGDIAKYSSDEYLEKIKKQYFPNIKDNKVNHDLVDQIVTNSNIAFNKFSCFKISTILLFITIIQYFAFAGITLIKGVVKC